MGIQGSGKGTQGKKLAKDYGYEVLEMGEECRAIAKDENSPIRKEIEDQTSRGVLVSDETVMKIVEKFYKEVSEVVAIIIDGFPRNESQRILLEEFLKNNNRNFKVLEVKISDEEVDRRLEVRANEEGRKDDNLESIKKRVGIFREETQPVINHWKEEGKVLFVNGEQSIEAVYKDVLAELELEEVTIG